jgi:hypothetical protein
MDSSVQHLNQLICGYWHSQCVYVAAKLGIADLLANGPLSIDDLAVRTGTHPPSLFRVLRALASLGVFAQEPAKRFRLTPAAELLQADIPDSKRALTILFGEEYFRAWGDLLYSVRTGKPAFDAIFGQPLFDFLSGHPEQAANFDKAMLAAPGGGLAPILDAYDFSSHLGGRCRRRQRLDAMRHLRTAPKTRRDVVRPSRRDRAGQDVCCRTWVVGAHRPC